jgi:anti-anti-sigma factor
VDGVEDRERCAKHTPVDDNGYGISHEPEIAGVGRVVLAGEFDGDNAAELTAALLRTVGDAQVDRIAVDLAGTTFLDSSAIRAVDTAYQAALDAGKQFQLHNLQPHLRRLFEILQMTALLHPQG